jgi:phosphopentomutase
MPDAAKYNDDGANTLANTAKAVGGLNLPTLQSLGIGNLTNVKGFHLQANIPQVMQLNYLKLVMEKTR